MSTLDISHSISYLALFPFYLLRVPCLFLVRFLETLVLLKNNYNLGSFILLSRSHRQSQALGWDYERHPRLGSLSLNWLDPKSHFVSSMPKSFPTLPWVENGRSMSSMMVVRGWSLPIWSIFSKSVICFILFNKVLC